MSFIAKTPQNHRWVRFVLLVLIMVLAGTAFLLINDRYTMGLVVVAVTVAGQYLLNQTKRFFEPKEPRYY